MKKIKIICLLVVATIVLSFAGCSMMYNGFFDNVSSSDYSIKDHWLALPKQTDKAVDVFYLYPTSWIKLTNNVPNMCSINDPTMLVGAAAAYSKQAPIFAPYANVFAPYYRQLDASYCLSISQEEQTELLSKEPKADVFAALDYYFEHYNNGRPFILAGHSQGSNMLLFVLSEYMKTHPDVYKRMIAAYVIGYSVTDDFLAKNPHLQFAQGADDTGTIISYNTEGVGVTKQNPVLLKDANVINPISWTREETTADASLNLGSVVGGQKIENLADATIDKSRGVLVCSTVKPEDFYSISGIFPVGVYHGEDYPFYYYNLMENVKLRIDSYMNKTK